MRAIHLRHKKTIARGIILEDLDRNTSLIKLVDDIGKFRANNLVIIDWNTLVINLYIDRMPEVA